MTSFYSAINKRDDFDVYVTDTLPSPLNKGPLFGLIKNYLAFAYSIRNFDVFHIPFTGGLLGLTPLRAMEPFLMRLARKKTIIIGYGADFYVYSSVMDPSLRHALLQSYPSAARQERRIRAAVERWSRSADIVIGYIMLDGLGRWDVLTVNPFAVDTTTWKLKKQYSDADGTNGVVRVIHTPNHRGFKGSEFVVDVIQQLRSEGLLVELLLLEKKSNEEVRQIMQESADILVEQLIYSGYALSGIEGMACGLPVLANLSDETYTRVFRRYAYLNECPILSTTPENLVDHLRTLIRRPQLRKALGLAGRAYVEKYHSYDFAQYLFGSIYKRIIEAEPIDLMNLFHPLKSDYVRRAPAIRHPLIENRLPPDYPLQC
jgi:hypothetical protein